MRTAATLIGILMAPLTATAAEGDYLSHVKPLLKERCFACHSALKQEGSLRLDAGSLIRQGGDSGPAIVASKPDESVLLERISEPDPSLRMPPEGMPLTPEQIAQIRAWIAQGAPVPEGEQPETDPRQHWAFLPPTRPAVPPVKNEDWVRNPIDAFIAAQHDERGLFPLASADKSQLLRRLWIDLVGVPPSRKELHAFLADESSDAYERMVDRLLDSPQYGERWGRHWMDVWRYSDWYGRRTVPDVLNSYGQIWRWRDWIVRSLNEDKGYDRMVMEMLAADELAPADDENIVATGYLVRNFYRWNYNSWMKDNVEHTGKAFLGLTFNCCQCHDHKYDPITQEEYFRFRAFFEPLEIRHDRSPGEADPGVYPKYVYGSAYKPIASGMVRIFDEKLDAETFMYSGGEARNIIPGKPPITPGGPALLAGDALTVEPVQLPPTVWYPGLKPFVQHDETVARETALQTARTELATAQQTLAQSEPQLVAEVQQKEAEFMAARDQAGLDTKSAALSGAQSLVMDATAGRRILAYRAPTWGQLEDGAVVSYRLQIDQDTSANFQLALDVTAGATGTYVAFEGGRILGYRPGTFETLDAGHYDVAAGQKQFDVRLVLNFSANTATLTVINTTDGKKLVDAVPVALNGWRPTPTDKQGLFFDARPGSRVVFDDIRIAQGEMDRVRLDFEPPLYADGKDVLAVEGWLESPIGLAPATSRVSRLETLPPTVAAADQQRQAAQRRLDAARLAVPAAEAKIAAAEAELASLAARIAADQARHIDAAPNADELARTAAKSERVAKLATARSQLAVASAELAAAEGLPTTDDKRTTAMQQAGQKLATARSALTSAEAAATESADYTALGPKYPQQSTGRRAALARWLADEQNPLTARVAVNHLWLRHFGQGIVSTPANFGRNGAAPSHPQLLDWLAVELMDHDWSMKYLHRLIVTSNTYRLASATHGSDHPNNAIDLDNLLLWRYTPQRLEAEAVRDSILHAAGSLDRTLGGPELDQSLGLTNPRRSLYFAHHGEARMPFLELFDAAAPSECYERTSSIRPQQALAMANAPLSAEQGRLLARQLWTTIEKETNDPAAQPAAFITAAFEQTLTRAPTPAEADATAKFLNEQTAFYTNLPAPQLTATAIGTVPPATDPAARARENLVQALLNHNDFVMVR